jgi:hypothetical protein
MDPKQVALEINKQAIILGVSEKEFGDVVCSSLLFIIWKCYETMCGRRTAKSLIKKLSCLVPAGIEMSFGGSKTKNLCNAVMNNCFNEKLPVNQVESISLECLRAYVQQTHGKVVADKFEKAVYKMREAL